MNIDKFISEKNRLYDLTEKYSKLYSKLLASCEHPEDKQIVEEKYYSGGYDYVASTEYYTKCTLCGKILDRRTVSHTGRYG